MTPPVCHRTHHPVISLCLPSRYRPKDLACMVESAKDTADCPDEVEVCVFVDDDDPEAGAYGAVTSRYGMRLTVGPRGVLSDCWNRAAETARGEVLMMCSDDLLFRTQDWDVLVAGAFDAVPDRIALVYGRDGIADERMATHPFVSRRWVQTVGYFTPWCFPADYADLWLHDVAQRIDRALYLPDLLIQHLHPSAGYGEYDRCHAERLARAEGADLPSLYESLLSDREDAAESLRAVML